MTTTLSFKAGLDRSPWRLEALAPVSFGAGQCIAYDMRNDQYRNPLAFFLNGTSAVYPYTTISDEFFATAPYAPAISGVGAGSAMVFTPSQGPGVGTNVGSGSIGTITTGATITSIVLSTALPAAVGTNQLANRGDGTGFRMRVIGLSSGGSGKTEEVTITKNTSGTTPTITFTPALSFTPASGDGYEILAGKLYCLGTGAIGASTWKSVDLATGNVAGLSSTNLAATIATDSFLLAMSELYVSNDRNPGDGFIDTNSTYSNGNSKCCVATASSSTTLTSAALVNPSTPSLSANEYRNFQVRIVEDTATPTSVGQRRNITSHTSGNTPVFTVPAFTVTPSSTCKFVVEQNNDRILCRTSASTNMYNYSVSGNAWDASTTWAAGGSANGAGNMIAPCFGLTRDATGNRLQGQMFVIRGAAATTIDMFDITAATTGSWSAGVTYGFTGPTFTTGACGCYDPVTLGGKYFHISVGGGTAVSRMHRFNVLTQTLELGTDMAYLNSTAVVGQRMFMGYAFDGTNKTALLYQMSMSQLQLLSQLVPY